MSASSDMGQRLDAAGTSPLTGAAWLETDTKQGSLIGLRVLDPLPALPGPFSAKRFFSTGAVVC